MPSNAPAMRKAGPITLAGWPSLQLGATRARTPGTVALAESDCFKVFSPHRTRAHPNMRRHGMARRSLPRKITYFEPIPPRLARNTIIESTFDVGRRFRCTMRVDCGRLDPDTIIRPVPGEWHPHIPERLAREELADWRAGRDAVYQLAALTIGARLAVADA